MRSRYAGQPEMSEDYEDHHIFPLNYENKIEKYCKLCKALAI